MSLAISIAAVPLVMGSMVASAKGPDPQGTIYVADYGRNSIDVFGPGAHGNVAPKRVLQGPSTMISGPADVAVDPAGHVYVSDFNSNAITEYAPGASGNAAPIRTIQGPKTELSNNDDMSLAPDGTLYVGNFGSPGVVIFAPGAKGDVAPIRTIVGGNTGIGESNVDGLGVDATGTLYADATGSAAIYVFAPGANGNATPIRNIMGPSTGLASPDDVKVGFGGNIFVSNGGNSFEEFAAHAHGDAKPIRLISGGLTGLSDTDDLTVDAKGNAYITNFNNGSVVEFGPKQNGNVAPKAVLAGANTTFSEPEGVAVATPRALSLTSSTSSTIPLGSATHDTAKLLGGKSPTGSIIFKLFGPGDAACSHKPAFTSPIKAVHGNGTYTSPSFTPKKAGTYSWIVEYSGDSNNAQISSLCRDASETVKVIGYGVTGHGHQAKTTVTLTWTVYGTLKALSFNILAITQQHKVIQMNTKPIHTHSSKTYTFVSKNVNVDIDYFKVKVKRSSGFQTFGPFVVKG